MQDVLLRLGLPRASLPQYAGDGVPEACAGRSSDGGVPGGCTCFRSAGRACYKPGACPWFPSAGGAPQQVLPHPQAEAPLEDVLTPPQTLESLVTVLAYPPPEEPGRLC